MTAKQIGKRLIQIVIVAIGISFLSFLITYLAPGDPVRTMYAATGMMPSEEIIEQTREAMGLNRPVLVQYVDWLWNCLHGDFGTSYQFHMPVKELLAERIPITIYLSVLATLIAMPLGVLFGVISAVHRGKPADTVITLAANVCSCLPQFWVGIFLMYVFAQKLGILPSFGFVMPPWEDFGEHIRHLIMPIICLSIDGIAGIARQTRSSMLESIRQDYVRTARAKGLKEWAVIYVHTLKNSMIPIVTLLGVRLSYMVGGSIFVESVFTIPGMGSLLVRAITQKDMPVVQACVMLTALVTCLAYIVTDVLYVMVDPRIKLAKND